MSALARVQRFTFCRGQPVAIKTVNQSSPSDKDVDAVRALLHEARILAKVRHPNVVTCYGGCITEDSVFIIEVRRWCTALGVARNCLGSPPSTSANRVSTMSFA